MDALRTRSSTCQIYMPHIALRSPASEADRVVFMEGGQIIEEGSPDVILRSPSTKRLQFFLEKLNITAFKPKSDVVTQQTMKSDLRM